MFITLEGIDGSGKSTQAERLEALLKSAGHKVRRTREPGDWSGGEALRSLLLTGTILHSWTEVLLFAADRCEHVSQVVAPALKRCETVICERYNDSTLVYQCWGRGLDRSQVESLLQWCRLPEPDLTFWLEIPPEMALDRRQNRGGDDRFEAERAEFHARLHRGFSQLAQEKRRIIPIDGTQCEERVTLALEEVLKQRGLLP